MTNFKLPRKAIKLNDGSTISLQASEAHYCTPRNDDGPYTHIEVGYPTDKTGKPIIMPESWQDYADSDGSSICFIWGYVPVELVEQYIASCGGRKTWS